MHKHTSIPLPAESLGSRLRSLLNEGYLASLVRGHWRWVLVVMTLCVSLGVYLALRSPTYQARVLMHDEDLCPHGYLGTHVIKSPSLGHPICPQCKPKDGK